MDNEVIVFIEECTGIFELLVAEKYQLSDVGLPTKTAFDWSNSGIYLRERKSKYRRKYTAVEYVWLRLVKELREFGLSIESLKKLKDFLIHPFDMYESIESMIKDEPSDQLDKRTRTLLLELREKVKSIDLDEPVQLSEKALLNTSLGQIIFSSVLSKTDIHLCITKDGNCLVFENSPLKDTLVSSHLMNAPYISFPINHIIGEFIAREELYDLDMFNEWVMLDEQEKKVLELLKQKDLTALNVSLDNGNVTLIETEEKIDIKNIRGKLVDLIERGAYQQISYKTQNGKVVTLNRKTKHKL